MNRLSARIGAASAVAGLALTVYALAARPAPEEAKAHSPLFEGLGQHHHPITTSSETAQLYFNQGLMLLFNFNQREAIRSFEAVGLADPNCAMAHWGIAYAHGGHINRPMEDDGVKPAREASRRALALSKKASPRERAYIEALGQRYSRQPVEDPSQLDEAYAEAMKRVASAYPDDLDAATLYAEAVMNTTPWDYWTEDKQPRPAMEAALAALEAVLARSPDHPGANHLYIHAVEAGPRPQAGLPSADRLAHYAPGLGHLTHMPSHIYVRVGQYREATEANERAILADERYIESCRA
jgi:tetratricopeptide (TPR) repeat protein